MSQQLTEDLLIDTEQAVADGVILEIPSFDLEITDSDCSEEIDLSKQYILEIIFSDEEEQKELYYEMLHRGIVCRVLTL